MELPIVSALEFDQVKSSIKEYIKTKTDFKDYDFEGSNLSMLVDILAYNTLYTNYNLNMASNELNLDTAVLRDNVVSIAKRLGYTANSYTSSKVSVDLTVTGIEDYDYVVLTAGSVLTANNNGKNYTFLTRNDIEANVKGKSQTTLRDISLVEGTEYNISYVVDSSNEHQRFFVPNNFVDSETFRVFVIPDPTNNIEIEYTKKDTIVDVNNADTVFFVEEVQDQKYEIVFGDDVIGRKVRDGEIIRISYVVTSGGQANGIKEFKYNGKIRGYTGSPADSSTTTEGILLNLSKIDFELSDSVDRSDGGSDYETIKSIKYRAPRYYASQERAVTLSDYESIIQQIYPNADLVRVIGGENLKPPRFGEVFIAIKPTVGQYVSDYEKDRIAGEMDKYKVGSVKVSVVDPEYLNFVVKPVIQYDPDKTRNRASDLVSLINGVVGEYVNSADFNKFGGIYSDLALRCQIKEIDDAIQYVELPVYLQQTVDLQGLINRDYDPNFYTRLKTDTRDPFYVITDPFCHVGIPSPVFVGAPSGCDSDNTLYLYNADTLQPIKEVGTVDPLTGEVDFQVQACDDGPINTIVIPEVIEIPTGPGTIPEITVLPPSINEGDDGDPPPGSDDEPRYEYPGIITSDPPPGDDSGGTTDPPGTPPITQGPGGGVPDIPAIPPDVAPPGDGDGDGIIGPPIDLDDFVPEEDPYSCS